MFLTRSQLLFAAVALLAILIPAAIATEDDEFLESWAVKVSPSEDPSALAASFGMRNMGQIASLEGYYHFTRLPVDACSEEETNNAADGTGRSRRSTCVHRRGRRDDTHTDALASHPSIEWAQQQVAKERVRRYVEPTDPMYKSQWYLGAAKFPSIDQLPVWKEGYTGKGVVLTIVDDGVERNNPELSENYDPKASYDFNDDDSDPMPRYSSDNINKHGTRCAGAASGGQNSHCGVGVAPQMATGGIRMLDGPISDVVEGGSLSFHPQHIDIYSCSWGPNDDGRTFEGPGVLATRAIKQGVRVGRGGLGSIYVWASGNGGSSVDNCNCDGYANAIETIGIGSASQHGAFPYYSEPCSARLAVTFSSGQASEAQVVTADLHQSCTDRFTGTSASAPLAAGIFGLVLEANPCLSWRDLQHLIVRTCSRTGLQGGSFARNGAGFYVSHEYAFGLLDANQLVQAAKTHTPVAPQAVVTTQRRTVNERVSGRGSIEDSIKLNGCDASGAMCIERLEHVQVAVNIFASRRGDVTVTLVSPSGTVSNLLTPRPRDDNSTGIAGWTFMTTHCWGESPSGTWTITVKSVGSTTSINFVDWQLILRGTVDKATLLSGELTEHARTPVSDRDDAHECLLCGPGTYADGEGGCRLCSANCTAGCFGPTDLGCATEEAEFLYVSPSVSDPNKVALLAVLVVLCLGGIGYAYLSMREKAINDARTMTAVFSIDDEVGDDPFSARTDMDDETRRNHLEFFSRTHAANARSSSNNNGSGSVEIPMTNMTSSPSQTRASGMSHLTTDEEDGSSAALPPRSASNGSIVVVTSPPPRNTTVINTASSSLEASEEEEDEEVRESTTLLNGSDQQS